jgi:hypothetical protein
MKRHLRTLVVSASLFSFALLAGSALAVSLPQGSALFETSLQSRISSTDTSMTLVANSVRGGGTLSGYNCFTVDEGRTDAEYICGTVSGTTVSSLERAVSPSNGTTTVSSIAHAHRVGADVKITDFPLIQRLRNLLNAVEQFPSLLSYVAGTDCTGLSASNSICGKSYIDSVAVAGASNATESVKGISELATQIEMASSTQLGSTLASLVLQAKNATSSPFPGNTGLYAVITRNDGKIDPAFIATSSANSYNWGGLHSFSATTTMATSTVASSSVSTLNVTNINVTGTATGIGTWKQLAATTTSVAMGIATTTIAAANDLRIVFFMPSFAQGAVCLQFNNDPAADYGSIVYNNFSVVNQTRGDGFLKIYPQLSTTTSMYYVIDIRNDASQRKFAQWTGSMSDATVDYPNIITGAGVWNNTSAQITTVVFNQNDGRCESGANIPAGSYIRIYGQ